MVVSLVLWVMVLFFLPHIEARTRSDALSAETLEYYISMLLSLGHRYRNLIHLFMNDD